MDRRKLLGLGMKAAEKAGKQQLIKGVAKDIPIQTKRTLLDVADTLVSTEKNPTISRRSFLGKLGDKLTIRQSPLNKEESVAHSVNNVVSALKKIKGLNFAYMGDNTSSFSLLKGSRPLTRKDALAAAGIAGTGTLTGAVIGYTHQKLDPSVDNTEVLHDTVAHSVGDGVVPASLFLAARKYL